MTVATAEDTRPVAVNPPRPSRTLRWLFVKERFAWPRASGHDVHTYGMMHALAEQGHAVSLCTRDRPDEAAVTGIPYASRYCLADGDPPLASSEAFPLRFTRLQAKFCSYWGVNPEHVRRVAAAAADCQADVVVVSGLSVLPYLGAIEGRATVWYAADEWVWHHLSMVRPHQPATWAELKPAAVKGVYERAYRRAIDRVWVVTDADARAFRWVAGTRGVDVLPNGVDADHYRPHDGPRAPNSCAFWGRLDFGPNVQALEWFCTRVWPEVRAAVPTATLRVFGFQPTDAVRRLTGRDGIELTADLPDLRAAVTGCQVAVLPFVSGGGIKNKLLEAAALGMPIVSTPRGCLGLSGTPPFAVHARPADWVATVTRLFADADLRQRQGAAAREWVTMSHTWAAAARSAVSGIRAAVGETVR